MLQGGASSAGLTSEAVRFALEVVFAPQDGGGGVAPGGDLPSFSAEAWEHLVLRDTGSDSGGVGGSAFLHAARGAAASLEAPPAM